MAFTLLRGGPEDLNYLVQHDRHLPTTPPNNNNDNANANAAAMIPLANVSGNIHDLYQDGGIDKLTRPTAVYQRPSRQPRYCN